MIYEFFLNNNNKNEKKNQRCQYRSGVDSQSWNLRHEPYWDDPHPHLTLSCSGVTPQHPTVCHWSLISVLLFVAYKEGQHSSFTTWLCPKRYRPQYLVLISKLVICSCLHQEAIVNRNQKFNNKILSSNHTL